MESKLCMKYFPYMINTKIIKMVLYSLEKLNFLLPNFVFLDFQKSSH